jgi:signal transduction histidine kinase
VAELPDLARREVGRRAFRPAALDLSRASREVGASFRSQTAQKRQRLVLQAPKGLPAVRGDPEWVAQILSHLLATAHEGTPEGGRITVAARAEGDWIALEVRGTGSGLSPAEEQAQRCTRFYRATTRTTQDVGGTGLELAITRALVAAHGGEITVRSSPGQGATFRVTLPAVPGAPHAPGDARGPGGSSAPSPEQGSSPSPPSPVR